MEGAKVRSEGDERIEGGEGLMERRGRSEVSVGGRSEEMAYVIG